MTKIFQLMVQETYIVPATTFTPIGEDGQPIAEEPAPATIPSGEKSKSKEKKRGRKPKVAKTAETVPEVQTAPMIIDTPGKVR